MGCLLVVIGATMPRLGMFAFWLLRPDRVEAAFDSFIVPLGGIIFLPTATLLYAVLETSATGLSAWGLFWVVVAAVFDLLHLGLNAAQWGESLPHRRHRAPDEVHSPY